MGLSVCWGRHGFSYRDVPFSQTLPLNGSFNLFLSITINLCSNSIVVRLCAIVYLFAHTRRAVSSHYRVFVFCNLCAGQTPAALTSISIVPACLVVSLFLYFATRVGCRANPRCAYVDILLFTRITRPGDDLLISFDGAGTNSDVL